MEYCEFNDLRSEISKRSMVGKEFSQAEILSIFRQVASVLKYLHSEGICHRDLKPENILYSKQSGQIKVIDLDVCGVKKSKTGKFDLWTNTGTLLYRAP
jgi:serine/threonine protein kinase